MPEPREPSTDSFNDKPHATPTNMSSSFPFVSDMETECYPCIPMQHVSVQNSPPLATMAPTFTASSATSKKARIVTTNGISNGGASWLQITINLHDS